MQLADLLQRRSVSPKRLGEPGPSLAQIHGLIDAAGAAPDHGCLQPWRFVLVRNDARDALAALFVDAAKETQGQLSAEQTARVQEKALNGACLIAVVVRLRDDVPAVPEHEQWVSVGASVQNLLLAAQLQGFGAMLVSGEKVRSRCLRAGLGLADAERLLGFAALGTASKAPKPRNRPSAETLLTIWPAPKQEEARCPI